MNKKLVISLTFLSIFILIGVGYQPILAEKQIEKVKESSVSDNKLTKLNNLFIRLVKIKMQSDNDCDCEKTDPWHFPIICNIIALFFIIVYIPLIYFAYSFPENIGRILGSILWIFIYYPVAEFAIRLNCQVEWWPWPSVTKL
jgi:hypothetical protein